MTDHRPDSSGGDGPSRDAQPTARARQDEQHEWEKDQLVAMVGRASTGRAGRAAELDPRFIAWQARELRAQQRARGDEAAADAPVDAIAERLRARALAARLS